ncbi:MAG: pilus assembly protein PilM [Phycisphaerales bacterium]
MWPQVFGASDLPIGVELHAGGVRLLQVRSGRGGSSVRAAAAATVDDKGRECEDPALIDDLVGAVDKAMSMGRFAGRRVVVGLDGRGIRTRSVRQAKLNGPELDRAVQLDAPSRLGFTEAEGCEIGWVRAGEVRQGDEIKDELIYVGARLEPLERLLTGLRACGLEPVAAEPSFAATARCYTRTLRRASDDAVTRVIVDVGEAAAEVMVTRGRAIAFYKQVELGGRAMTRLCAERLGLDVATVADLRRRRMASEAGVIDPKVDRALYDAVRPLMSDLAQEVTLCLRYFSVTFRGARPDGVVVVGQEAGEPRLAQTLGEALHVPSSVGRPLDGYDLSRVVGGGFGALDAGGTLGAGSGALWGACVGLSTRVRELASPRETRVWKARAAA